MLGEDPPHLADNLGMILAQVAGRDHPLRLGPGDMGAVVGHQAIRPQEEKTAMRESGC